VVNDVTEPTLQEMKSLPVNNELNDKLSAEFKKLKESLLNINMLLNQNQGAADQISPEIENNCNGTISLWNAVVYELSSK
jgi:hypothetical protein